MPAAAIKRIVVQTTLSDKQALVAKAKAFDMTVSELLRRGAFAYSPEESDQDLGALADASKGASDRAGSAIDDALAFIAASNKRIASMEAAAKSSKAEARAAR